jgi:hypothetical protein
MNFKNKKKSLLHHFNKNILFNINKDNLNLLSIQKGNNKNVHRFKYHNYYSLISYNKNINKNVINSKIL